MRIRCRGVWMSLAIFVIGEFLVLFCHAKLFICSNMILAVKYSLLMQQPDQMKDY